MTYKDFKQFLLCVRDAAADPRYADLDPVTLAVLAAQRAFLQTDAVPTEFFVQLVREEQGEEAAQGIERQVKALRLLRSAVAVKKRESAPS